MKRKTLKAIKFLLKPFLLIALLILGGYIFVYFKQERFFFNPKTLSKDYKYHFNQKFEEINIPVDTDIELNTLLFKTDSVSKGVILYLHGNAGALHEWGERAPLYLENGYDVFFVDYRGYGKSDSFYSEESQIYNDADKIYAYLKTKYNEDKIIVLGYSLGSGIAAYIASKNSPKLLILEAPYYAWDNNIANIAPMVPEWMINYKIPTYRFLANVRCPINLYYGTRDFLIDPKLNAQKLKELYPKKINLVTIDGAGHNSIFISKQYYDILKEILKD